MSRNHSPHPFLGVGLEWSDPIEDGILENIEKLSLVEMIPENFFHGRRSEYLRELGKTGVPVLVHGVELSIGTDEPLKEAHFEQFIRIADQVNTANLSDHLCFTEAGGVEIGQLTPLHWSIPVADVVCRKIDQIQKRIHVPFLIENITNRFIVPEPEMTETEFINLILRRTGCHLMLDLHNVHTNAYNFHFDPYEWIDSIDLDRVSGIHLAGGHLDYEGTRVDSHSALAPDEVWQLYRYVCERIRPACTIVEWTDLTPPFNTLLDEVGRARAILAESEACAPRTVGARGGVR